MLYYNVRLLYAEARQIGPHTANYRLCEYSDPDGTDFIFFVKYNGTVNRCTLGCATRAEALRRFSLLTRSRTTPLSLIDSVYEMHK